MPKKFTDCVNSGGRVRTVSLPKNKYLKVCYPKGGGVGIQGEVKKKKS
jgi:hypothetical protein